VRKFSKKCEILDISGGVGPHRLFEEELPSSSADLKVRGSLYWGIVGVFQVERHAVNEREL
jgi:hypothetical protein